HGFVMFHSHGSFPDFHRTSRANDYGHEKPAELDFAQSGIPQQRTATKEDVMAMQAAEQTRKVVHADIKPENPADRASHYLDAPNMPWEATKFPGIKIKVLYSDDSGITTALFKLDPGAVVPLHEHTALEQTYVIEGTLEDHEGVCGPGQ